MQDTSKDPADRERTIDLITRQLTHYAHPKLMPPLFHRAIYDQSASSAQAFSDLVALTGLKYPRADRQQWEAWWRKAQPVLADNFELQTSPGRQQWMDCYYKADPATQKILMNLWFFQSVIDEEALLEASAENDAAKYVLSELWQRQRLSVATRKSIVQRFVTFKVIDLPPDAAYNDPTLYGASWERIVTFPFPMKAWVHTRSNLVMGDFPPTLEGYSWGDHRLGYIRVDKPTERNILTPATTNHSASPPQARGAVEYQEIDFQNSGKVLWTVRWNLGPIQLTNPRMKQEN